MDRECQPISGQAKHLLNSVLDNPRFAGCRLHEDA
jgi:hypothetical protein